MNSLRRLVVAATAACVASTAVISPAFAQETAGPKNIIFMIGDGMGYGHIAQNNLFETGQSKYLVEGPFAAEGAKEVPGESVQSFEDFDRLSMATYPKHGTYDPAQAWATHDWVKQDPITDSAAAGTALATGMKTINGIVGKSEYGHSEENLSERAKRLGKAAGIVTSVNFADATPAAYGAHNMDRNDAFAITHEMLGSDLDLVMGAGHPFYNNDHQKLDTPDYSYISEQDFADLTSGKSGWQFVEDNAQFEAMAAGDVKPNTKYWGIPQVGGTLQAGRSGESELPFGTPANDVVDLPTMTTGALNALNQDEDGFHVMIEGGAIDWTGHGNNSVRNIEEVQDFNEAVDAAIEWVEKNSSWEETLLVVTADHETGYLSGPNEDKDGAWKPMTGAKGQLPKRGWYSGQHTNMLVPFFFKGAGSEDIKTKIEGTDPVRGEYIDNVSFARLVKTQWWLGNGAAPDDDADADNSNNDDKGSSPANNGVAAGLTGAGIVAAIVGALFALAQSLGIIGLNLDAIRKFLPKGF